MANFRDPLFWAVLVGWIMSVVLHEFAHGIVAYRGGDYTIRERGGLTLNPLQYIDPFFSILLPIVFLFMGGIPLPGGSTYVRRDLLRGPGWNSAVSLAGPLMNFLLFLACAIPLHPKFGWLDPTLPIAQWTNAQLVLSAMALLQILAVVFNLIPVPPLDGFQALSPWLPRDVQQKLSTPPWSTGLTIGFFILIVKLPIMQFVVDHVASPLLDLLGFEPDSADSFWQAFHHVLFQ